MKKIKLLSSILLFITLIPAMVFPQQIIVKTGIDVLKSKKFSLLEGKRVGLITNPTGVDSKLKSTIDILYEAKNVNLTAIYGPEHGARGDYAAGDKIGFYTDSKTNLPVYSLYGKTRKPTKEMLNNVDVLVYDIQDIGSRSYTYISTMGKVMEAAAENNIEFVVLDRPNPLGGNKIEGCLVEDDFFSFVSQFKIPYIYGLTCGELAKMLNEESMLIDGVKCKLSVVPMEGWKREMTFEETGLEWVPASPHIPYKHSPFYYPVTGILGELGLVSIGVGYTLPFKTIAAEWIESDKLAESMNSLKLDGVIFRPISYVPYYAVSQGEKVHGVEIHITDFSKVKLTEIQFYFMQVNNELYPDKKIFELANERRFSMFDKVCGSDKVRETFSKNYKFDDIKEMWYEDVASFRKLSAKYYLYE